MRAKSAGLTGRNTGRLFTSRLTATSIPNSSQRNLDGRSQRQLGQTSARPASTRRARSCDPLPGLRDDVEPLRATLEVIEHGAPLFTDTVLARAVRRGELHIGAIIAIISAAGETRDVTAAAEAIGALGELAEGGRRGVLAGDTLGVARWAGATNSLLRWHGATTVTHLQKEEGSRPLPVGSLLRGLPATACVGVHGWESAASFSDAIVAAGGLSAILSCLRHYGNDDASLARRSAWALTAIIEASAASASISLEDENLSDVLNALWAAHSADSSVLRSLVEADAALRRLRGEAALYAWVASGAWASDNMLKASALARTFSSAPTLFAAYYFGVLTVTQWCSWRKLSLNRLKTAKVNDHSSKSGATSTVRSGSRRHIDGGPAAEGSGQAHATACSQRSDRRHKDSSSQRLEVLARRQSARAHRVSDDSQSRNESFMYADIPGGARVHPILETVSTAGYTEVQNASTPGASAAESAPLATAGPLLLSALGGSRRIGPARYASPEDWLGNIGEGKKRGGEWVGIFDEL